MLQRSVTLIRRLVCTRPRRSVSGDVLVMVVIANSATGTRSPAGRSRLYVIRCRGGPIVDAVGPLFAFPDRHVVLQRVDQPLAGGEGVAAVRRADGDRDAGFGGRYAAEAMGDTAFYHWPAAAGFGFQIGQLSLGHFAVGFVVERDSLSAGGQFSGCAEEQHDGAGFRVADAVE